MMDVNSLFRSLILTYMNAIYFLIKLFLKVCGVSVVLGTLYIIYDIYRKRRASSHTVLSGLYQYLVFSACDGLGSMMKETLEDRTKRCKEVQLAILYQRIRRDRYTVYGRMHHFARIKSVSEFKKHHPLIRYDKVKPYVDRIMEGEENVLTAERPPSFCITEGTSGRPTIIPRVKKELNFFGRRGTWMQMNRMFDSYPSSKQLQKGLNLYYCPNQHRLPAGVPVSADLVSFFYLLRPSGNCLYTTPRPAYSIRTEEELLYIHLLFALSDSNLGIIEASYTSLIHSAFVAMELQWQQLTEDIQTGRINPNLDIPGFIRESVQKHLQADPDRAAKLRFEFSQGFKGIAKRLWPHLNVMLAADTGAFDLYGRKLKSHYANGIPIYSALYTAAEGLVGINLWPKDEDRYYMLMPDSMFYEFIPIQDSSSHHSGLDQPETLLMDEVEEGATYELVITNHSGLYRYRLGDVVKVVRFHNQCPVVEFICRKGQVLNVRGENIDEDYMYSVLLSTVNSWPDTQLVDYSTMESVMLDNKAESKSPFYVVFLELSTDCEISEEQKKMVDENLCEKSFVYNSFRERGSINPMQVHIVKPGSFRRLKAYLLANTPVRPDHDEPLKQIVPSSNHFKVPRVLRNEGAVAFMTKYE